MMNVHSFVEHDLQIVVPSGRINSENATEFEEQIRALIDKAAAGFVLDLSEMEYIASSGLRAILLVAKDLEILNVQFALAAVSEQVLGVLKIAGFLRLMDALPSRQEAIETIVQRINRKSNPTNEAMRVTTS